MPVKIPMPKLPANFAPNSPPSYLHRTGSNKSCLIDLSKEAPTPHLLPAASLAFSSREVLTHPYEYTDALLVGGTSKLRGVVANWLSTYYAPDGGTIGEERIAVTTGIEEGALVGILGRFTDPVYTRVVWAVLPAEVEWLKGIARDAGLDGKFRTLPEGNNGQGIDVEMFQIALQEEEDRALASRNVRPVFKIGNRYPKIYKSILYLQPTFKNPTGSTIPLPVRKRLIELAREYDVLIVAEEDFDFVRWGEEDDEPPIPRLCDLDRAMIQGASKYGNAISCGSFSRVIAPGCRVGWIEGCNYFIEEFDKTNSTKASQLMAAILWSLLNTGTLQSHLANVLIPVYQKRHSVIVSAITTSLAPLGVNLITDTSRTSGGWFLWMQLPNYCDASFLGHLKTNYNLILASGGKFGAGLEDFVRICLAWEAEEELVEAVRRISECLQAIKPKSPVRGIGIRDLCAE
ncbi:PLP-dependent transferase [Choiromyces venosus 120613-1]|uniref:PLP-dependent transferase n=1 Tax=Choiromyces venosus 120613-1 TaxID=1336337 RepID=A0A3N4JWA3_9PEZI|nr:PLP-dependent transferase [Choiromyces venosus 120613-1]